MELIGAQDLDERMAALRAEVERECAEGNERAREAAAEAVSGPMARAWLTGREWLVSPVTPEFEGRARVVALLAMALPVIALVIALILAS